MFLSGAEHTVSSHRDGQTYVWDVHKLWKLAAELDVVEVPVVDLEHHLDEMCWFDTAQYVPTVKAIAEHSEKIQGADLSFPIILSTRGEVMDGMHRLAKAWLEGKPTIKAVQFPEDPDPDYIEGGGP